MYDTPGLRICDDTHLTATDLRALAERPAGQKSDGNHIQKRERGGSVTRKERGGSASVAYLRFLKP